MNKAHLFATITKVDATQRLVYGRITEETLDKSKEIFDYDTSKAYFENWSDGISKATGGKSLGNVRLMHQPIIAGKLTSISFDDAAKTIDCCSKVLTDEAWDLIEAGGITGFSMGGAYVKRWPDPLVKGATRFTANPAEVSYVDNPCVPTATFSMVKADGIVEDVAFKVWAPENAAVANKAVEMATAAGKDAEAFEEFIEPAREALVAEKAAEAMGDVGEEAPAEPETPAEPTDPAEPEADPVDKAAAVVITDEDINADLKQVQRWAAPDGTEKATKAEAREYWRAVKVLELSGSPLALAIAQAKKAAAPVVIADTSIKAVDLAALADEAEEIGKALAQLVAIASDKVEKGLWTVSSLAEAIARLVGVCRDSAWEAKHEGDNSAVPNTIAGAIAQLGGALIAMAREEVAEALAELSEDMPDVVEVWTADVTYVELAAAATMVKADAALMEKVGARNSKKDAAKIQATHDHMAELGAKCAGADKSVGDELAKVVGERDNLAKQVEQAIPEIAKFGTLLAEVNGKLTKAQEEIEVLKAAPAPMPQLAPGTKVVGKGADGSGGDTKVPDRDAAIAFMKGLGPDGLKNLMLDAAFANPIAL